MGLLCFVLVEQTGEQTVTEEGKILYYIFTFMKLQSENLDFFFPLQTDLLIIKSTKVTNRLVVATLNSMCATVQYLTEMTDLKHP